MNQNLVCVESAWLKCMQKLMKLDTNYKHLICPLCSFHDETHVFAVSLKKKNSDSHVSICFLSHSGREVRPIVTRDFSIGGT